MDRMADDAGGCCWLLDAPCQSPTLPSILASSGSGGDGSGWTGRGGPGRAGWGRDCPVHVACEGTSWAWFVAGG